MADKSDDLQVMRQRARRWQAAAEAEPTQAPEDAAPAAGIEAAADNRQRRSVTHRADGLARLDQTCCCPSLQNFSEMESVLQALARLWHQEQELGQEKPHIRLWGHVGCHQGCLAGSL